MPLPPTVLIADIPITAELYSSIWAVSALYGMPPWLLGSIVFAETGFREDTTCGIPGERSYGPLQLNIDGGQGQGFPVAVLQQPTLNLLIGAKPIAHAYHRAVARAKTGLDLILTVLASSGHNRSDGVVTPDVEAIARRALTILVGPNNQLLPWPEPWR
jgi:hypothetical protein